MSALFSDRFLAAVDRLRIDIRPAPPRPAQGMHLSPHPGASMEFRDFQSYSAGDDLRRVDWNVYARSRHLFVRRFDHPTAVPVTVLVDGSESMRLESPSRYATAARVAAAIAAASLSTQNPVSLTIADGATAGMARPVTGRRGLVHVLGELAAERTAGGPGIVAGLQKLLPGLALKTRGVLVIISDFFEAQGVEALIDTLRRVHQRLLLVRVTQPWDTQPDLVGDFELLDCESDAVLTVSTSTQSIKQYSEAYRAYFAALDAYVSLCGATGHSIDASRETLPQLERLFPAGRLSL